MTLRTLHRTTAWLIALFAVLHLSNHAASLLSIPTHIAFMDVARQFYRQPLVEMTLLLSVAMQIGSGARLLLRGWRKRRGAVAWLQAGSGAVLLGFLLVHVSAVLVGRWLLHLDTNFYFSAAGFHVPPFPYLFVPYYFLGVLAWFTHLGCAAYWHVGHVKAPSARRWVLALPMLLGAVLAGLLVLSLAGKIQPLVVPAKYLATYG